MSNITIPRGPMRGGQSANLTQQPTSAGPALRDAGAKLFRSATVARRQFEANEFNQARLNMTRDLDALRLEYEQTTDPQAIETGWPERTAQMRAHYVDGASSGLKDPVGLTFDTLVQSHALPVARHAQGMRVSQSAGTWREYVQTHGASWYGAPPEVQAQSLAQGDAMIEADLAAGFISPEEAVQRRQQLRVTGLEAEAIALVDEDPVRFLELSETRRYDPLGGDAVERFRKSARTNQRQMEAQEARRIEQEIEARNRALDQRIDTVADLTNDGFNVRGLYDLLDSPEAQARPGFAKLRAAANLLDLYPNIQAMTPRQLRKTHDTLRQAEISEPWEAEQIKLLEGMIERAEDAWADDPIGQAAAAGVDVQPLDMTALRSAASPAQFAARRDHARNMEQEGYVRRRTDALLSPEEKAALSQMLATDQRSNQREVALRPLLVGFGADALPLLEDILPPDDAPAVRQAARVFLGGQADDRYFGRLTLQAVLKGREKINARTVNLPSQTVRNDTFDAVTAGYFDDDPFLRADIEAAALAIYAASAESLNPAQTDGNGALASDGGEAYARALQMALGGVENGNGKLLGGLQEVRGAVVQLPPGVSAKAAEDVLDRAALRAQSVVGAGHGIRPQKPSFAALEAANRAAQSRIAPGDAPRPMTLELAKGGDADPAEILREAQLRRVGDGIYVLYRPGRGVLEAAQGGDFYIDLRTLIEVAR